MALNKKGFTLVEMMVVFAIIGILVATSIPAYNTIRQRIYGSEAKVMLNQIINAQIAYYLENDKYYGEVGKPLCVYHVGEAPVDAKKLIYDNLHLEIPQGHYVDYDLTIDPDGKFLLTISTHPDANFTLFKGSSTIIATLDKDGKIVIDTSGI
jgi:prepilin-type N-terminal cleavage/methylation domain-containing protein